MWGFIHTQYITQGGIENVVTFNHILTLSQRGQDVKGGCGDPVTGAITQPKKYPAAGRPPQIRECFASSLIVARSYFEKVEYRLCGDCRTDDDDDPHHHHEAVYC